VAYAPPGVPATSNAPSLYSGRVKETFSAASFSFWALPIVNPNNSIAINYS
jgi:hypothetical protein